MPVPGRFRFGSWWAAQEQPTLRQLHEGLSKEVAGFGIKVTLIEPGAYATEFGRGSSLKLAAGLDAYAGIWAQLYAYAAEVEGGRAGAATR